MQRLHLVVARKRGPLEIDPSNPVGAFRGIAWGGLIQLALCAVAYALWHLR
jgi:hypothetical protein